MFEPVLATQEKKFVSKILLRLLALSFYPFYLVCYANGAIEPIFPSIKIK